MHTCRLDRKVAAYFVLWGALVGACGAPAEEDDPDANDATTQRAASSASGSQGPFASPEGAGGGSAAPALATGPAPGSGDAPSPPDRTAAGASGAAMPGPGASDSHEPAGGGTGGSASSSGGASGSGGGASMAGAGAEPSVSFEQDVLPVLRANCASCHASGRLPRFASSDVDTAFSVAVTQSQRMVTLIAGGDMPPACSGRAPGGRSCVSVDDFNLIQDWVRAGTPR